MRFSRATLAVAFTSTVLGVAPAAALASPADVHVRVEGATTTLYDRVVRTDAITLQTPWDISRGLPPHACDGTNGGRYRTPGPTPTGATADAMSTIGQDLDAEWFSGFEDYFLTRVGPDAEDDATGRWWGIVVNAAFTPVGGCQLQVVDGDEVLWIFDAFSGRPFLWLSAPATVAAGAPFDVAVVGNDASGGVRTGDAYAGATVGAIDADARPVADGIATGGATTAAGVTSVTFSQPGWHRLKARDQAPGGYPSAIPSNAVDVCVEATAGAGCAGLPPSQQPVVPPRLRPEPRTPVDPPRRVDPPVDPPRSPPAPPALPGPPAPSTAPVKAGVPAIDPSAAASGRVAVRWTLLDVGVGVRGWSVAAKPLGVRKARWSTRAHGTTATQALLRLPPGRSYELRLSVTDVLGRVTRSSAGRAFVPLDDRARALRFSAGWRPRADAGAWLRTVTGGRRDASLRVRLGAGRPTFALRATRGTATVEVRAGRRRQTFRVPGSPHAATRMVTAARRGAAGDVTLRVLSGTVDVDGAGLVP